MKLIIGLYILLVSHGLNTQSKQSSEQINSKRFIFFLHNRFIEEAGLDGVHPEYGKVEYDKIVKAFKSSGFEVLSNVRPKNTGVTLYADKIVKQVDSLIRLGIAPSHVTVIGTSKGGYIAMFVSSRLKNPKVNFVFVGCCSEEDLTEQPEINFCGNILSIYEKSDATTSCLKMKERSTNNVTTFKEIELNTGLKHGYLYKAMPEWMDPAIQWAGSSGKSTAVKR